MEAGLGAGPAAPAGPNDPALMRAMAGQYYSYSGSTERKVTLRPSGTFFGSSESRAWGAASQNQSSGNWSVQGSQQGGTITLGYRGGKTEQVR